MTQSDELLWLAYRFSAGELSSEETLKFESRLAVDQAAREALAQAVGLTETVYALEHSVPLGDRAAKAPARVPAALVTAASVSPGAMHRSWSQEAGWIAAAVAACVALVMTWQVFRADRVETAVRTAAPVASSQADVAPVDDETRLLLAMLDQEPTAPVAAPIAEVGMEDMSESEFELVLDGTAIDGSMLDGGTADESLEDQNATPDWLLAAVAESQS